jgi:hypothetical protein
MIFWLVLKLEIRYRVIISWRFLVSFRGFFEDYSMLKYLSFHNSCLKILFNVNGKATSATHPLLSMLFALSLVWLPLFSNYINFLLQRKILKLLYKYLQLSQYLQFLQVSNSLILVEKSQYLILVFFNILVWELLTRFDFGERYVKMVS